MFLLKITIVLSNQNNRNIISYIADNQDIISVDLKVPHHKVVCEDICCFLQDFIQGPPKQIILWFARRLEINPGALTTGKL